MVQRLSGSDTGVEELLRQLRADQQRVDDVSIQEQESDIDEAVYNLFDLTDEEQAVIEEYLDVF